MIVRSGSFLSSLAAHLLVAGSVWLGGRGDGRPARQAEAPEVRTVYLSRAAEDVRPHFAGETGTSAPFEPPRVPDVTIDPDVAPEAPAFRPAPGVVSPLPRRLPTARAPAPSAEPDADEATTRPRALATNPPPPYPEVARRLGYEGRVVLRVTVSNEGGATDAALLRGSGHAVLDGAARDAVLRWRFEPALRRGRPVEGALDVGIRFRLTD